MSRVFHIDGAAMTDRSAAMAHLTAALDLPDWWGRNWDALSDCLCVPDFDGAEIVWANHDQAVAYLGDAARIMTSVFEERQGITLTLT